MLKTHSDKIDHKVILGSLKKIMYNNENLDFITNLEIANVKLSHNKLSIQPLANRLPSRTISYEISR